MHPSNKTVEKSARQWSDSGVPTNRRRPKKSGPKPHKTKRATPGTWSLRPTDPVLIELVEKAEAATGRPRQALMKACDEAGVARLSPHDLRHLFVTRCIESGVDIRTIAAWIGHKDGGALLLKRYAHLRREHSQAMAKLVKF